MGRGNSRDRFHQGKKSKASKDQPAPTFKKLVVFQPGKTGAPLKWTEETIDNTITPALEKYLLEKQESGEIPWEREFAFLNHLSRADFDNKFAVRSDRFRSALQNLREIQRQGLVQGGLSETTNPAFTQFVLRNEHRDVFSDDTKLVVDGGLPVEVKITHGVSQKA